MTALGVLNCLLCLGVLALFLGLSWSFIRMVRGQLAPLHPANTVLFVFDILHLLFGAFLVICFLFPLACSEVIFGGRELFFALCGPVAPWTSGYGVIVDPHATLLGKVFSLLLIVCFLFPWHRIWVTILCFRRHLSDQQAFALFSIVFFYWPEMLFGLIMSGLSKDW